MKKIKMKNIPRQRNFIRRKFVKSRIFGDIFSMLIPHERSVQTNFENNPFFDCKGQLFFDRHYSEKDFYKDCWYFEKIIEKKLLTEHEIEQISYYLVGQLKDKNRKINKIAKETLTYIIFLRQAAKEDVKQIDKK